MLKKYSTLLFILALLNFSVEGKSVKVNDGPVEVCAPKDIIGKNSNYIKSICESCDACGPGDWTGVSKRADELDCVNNPTYPDNLTNSACVCDIASRCSSCAADYQGCRIGCSGAPDPTWCKTMCMQALVSCRKACGCEDSSKEKESTAHEKPAVKKESPEPNEPSKANEKAARPSEKPKS